MLADRLIQEYKTRGHPLGEVLQVDETDALILLLRVRLAATEDELNLAPYSLKRLEEKLRAYYQSLQERGQHLTDDEVVQLVREVAAYFGIVLLRHADGIWRGGRSLRNTEVGVDGPIKVIDGSYRFTSPQMVLSLGNQAASAWDAITKGKSTHMYSTYLAMRKKISKQRLTKSDGWG